MTAEPQVDVRAMAVACRDASRAFAALDGAAKNRILARIAELLPQREAAILAANQRDLTAAREKGLSGAMVDRLALTPQRLRDIAEAVLEVAAQADPVGEVTRMWRRPNGLLVGRQRIPLGVIAMIYESRPNVTVDAAALCLKAGNAVILRGGSEAFASNTALASVLQEALAAEGAPAAAVSLIATTDRAAMNALLALDDLVDLAIPRGGEGLIRFVNQHSAIPVIKHYKGVCHLYVDAAAEPDTALRLLLDGKTSRPGVCNALETMLVHRAAAPRFMPAATAALDRKDVEIRGCEATRAYAPQALAATDEDYAAEFLDLTIAVKIVDRYEDAIAHIQRFGSDHTEIIATEDYRTAQRFLREVNSSVVLVNASSRFSDGGQLGLGAEIGISTTKLHAFGPMGLTALTTEKFIVYGEGQVRHPSAVE